MSEQSSVTVCIRWLQLSLELLDTTTIIHSWDKRQKHWRLHSITRGIEMHYLNEARFKYREVSRQRNSKCACRFLLQKSEMKILNMNKSVPCHTLQTISIPHELSPWLCTPIFSTLLITPRGTSTTKGGSWNLWIKQKNLVTSRGTHPLIIHVCFIRVNDNFCLIDCCGTSCFTYNKPVTFWNLLQQYFYPKGNADR